MASQESPKTGSVQEETEGQERERKNFRFSSSQLADLELIRAWLSTLTGEEPSYNTATAFAYHFTAQSLPPVITAPILTSHLLRDVTAVASLLTAFLEEALVAMQEQEADEQTCQLFIAELLAHISDPMYIASILSERIGNQPVWLQPSGSSVYQYEQAVQLLQRCFFHMADRYPSQDNPAPAATHASEYDLKEPVRLYIADLYAVYERTLFLYEEASDQQAFLNGLLYSVRAFLRPGRASKKKETLKRQ